MSGWKCAGELSVWQEADVEGCRLNCLICEHCVDITIDGKEIMVLCDAQD